jgi:hypothetical protein
MDCCQDVRLACSPATGRQMAHRMSEVRDRRLETLELVVSLHPPIQRCHHENGASHGNRSMKPKSTGFVAYYRVSTDGQGRSGLGLEAQRAAVGAYLASVGGTLLAEFTEVETGKRNERPELH